MPRAFRQRIAIRKRKLTTTRSTLMRHILSYRDWLTSSNAEVAFVRANFTAGRGHAWGGRPGSEIGNGANGFSDIEGKVARVAASELGSERVSTRGNASDFTFNRSLVIPAQ